MFEQNAFPSAASADNRHGLTDGNIEVNSAQNFLIAELFRRWITGARDEGLRASVRLVAATPWVELPRRGAVPAAAAAAYQNAFGVQPVFLRSGGSIGVVSAFQRLLGIPIVLMGFGLPSDGAHGPNEKFHLPTFIRGLETLIWFMRNIGAIGGQQPR